MKKENDPSPSWYRELEETPFDKPQWSTERQRQLRERLHMGGRNRMKFLPARWKAAAGAVLLMLMLTGILLVVTKEHPIGQSVLQRETASPLPVALQVAWDVLPGGESEVGIRGAQWFLSRPLSELHGQQVLITATHQASGFTFEEIPATIIDETFASEYEARTRLVSEMIVPLPGTWRYDLYLDDVFQGSKALEIEGPEWAQSPTFRSGAYTLEGIEGRLGLLNGGFKAGQVQKHMWHFWGTEQQVTGEVDVYAVQAGTSRLEHILKKHPLQPGPLNGADAVLHCHMTISDPGQWTLLLTINDRLVGSVPVEVKIAE